MRSTCVDSEVRHIADTGCIATIGSTRAAQAMQAAAADLGVKVPCHLKIDTGMGRYGFLPCAGSGGHCLLRPAEFGIHRRIHPL